MLLLACLCAVITAILIAVVSLWHRHAPPVDAATRARTVYAAFVADVERREARGEVDAALANEERVEAARALLQADAASPVSTVRFKPVHAIAPVAVVAALSFGLYIFTGHPDLPDQPYDARLKQWTQAAALPECLPSDGYDQRLTGWLSAAEGRSADLPAAEALAAVVRQSAVKCQNVAAYWQFLARIDKVAGNYYASRQDFLQARNASKDTFADWSEWGEAMTLFAGSDSDPDARKAFEAAIQHDPKDMRAHYYLGRSDLVAGDYASARGHFTEALAQLPQGDGRRSEILAEIQAVDTAQTAEAATHARIKGMVTGLAAKLAADPENADGWARLLRAYDVLDAAAAKAAAVAAMRAHYHDRPAIAAQILERAQGAVGSENTGAAQ